MYMIITAEGKASPNPNEKFKAADIRIPLFINIPNSSFISFNCKSVKRNIDFVRSLCRSAYIVALQETWLLPHDVSILGTIDQDFAYTGKSAVDTSAGMLRGRPYGGLAILWRKSVFRSVSIIDCVSARISAIQVVLEDRQFLVFSIYMPTDSAENLAEFTGCLSEISAVIDSCNICRFGFHAG